jgi:CHAD domain-containing protein
MKHKEIARKIKRQFHAIAKLAKQSTHAFDEDILHEFKVEVKKLRAFLRLINTEAEKNGAFKIPKKLKLFYKHIGVIRSIQLHLLYIDKISPNANHAIKPYLQILYNEMDEWKKEAAEIVPGKEDIDKEKSITLYHP